MTRARNIATAAVALATVACATTTDPYECANQGIGSVLSGCPDDVERETIRIKETNLDSTVRDTEAITAKIEERKKHEAELQQQVNDLLAELDRQKADLSALGQQLREKRQRNRISEATFNELDGELRRVNEQIETYQGIEPALYTSETAGKLQEFMETDIVTIRNLVQEVELG